MVTFAKKPDTITIVPAGPVPFLELFEPSLFIDFALNISFIQAFADEMDAPPKIFTEFHSGVRDASIEGLLILPDAELQAGAPSGPLYVESLGHALAVRFVLADTPHDVHRRCYNLSSAAAPRSPHSRPY